MGNTCSECVSWDELPKFICEDGTIGVCQLWLDEHIAGVIRTGKPSYFDIEAVLVRSNEAPEEFDCPYFEARP